MADSNGNGYVRDKSGIMARLQTLDEAVAEIMQGLKDRDERVDEKLDRFQDRILKKFDIVNNNFSDLNARMAAINVKAGVWGALGVTLGAIGAALLLAKGIK